MRPSEHGGCGVFAAVALIGILAAQAAGAAGLTLGSLRIESNPPGAEVLLIGGAAGFTPLTIGERAIYPNDYPDERAHLYGTVTLRRPGCETVVHRVTLDDLKHGLNVALDCKAAAPGALAEPAGRTPHPVSAAPDVRGAPAPSPGASPADVPAAGTSDTRASAAGAPIRIPAGGESAPERRLRQLQVLQELLDEGIVTGAEEQRIRRRLLEPLR
ncbi:MAG TPA: PEGA domain-containing protein [Thiobacillaceae bacterium]|nr:PEGA domain-containing protein [Thiobacillaceae bacterium]